MCYIAWILQERAGLLARRNVCSNSKRIEIYDKPQEGYGYGYGNGYGGRVDGSEGKRVER